MLRSRADMAHSRSAVCANAPPRSSRRAGMGRRVLESAPLAALLEPLSVRAMKPSSLFPHPLSRYHAWPPSARGTHTSADRTPLAAARTSDACASGRAAGTRARTRGPCRSSSGHACSSADGECGLTGSQRATVLVIAPPAATASPTPASVSGASAATLAGTSSRAGIAGTATSRAPSAASTSCARARVVRSAPSDMSTDAPPKPSTCPSVGTRAHGRDPIHTSASSAEVASAETCAIGAGSTPAAPAVSALASMPTIVRTSATSPRTSSRSTAAGLRAQYSGSTLCPFHHSCSPRSN
mmetsp:Transcript_23419/g.60241  ORF Transcript_23419/g.60241 Transcript_23419/m.60241 type:complete len:298 (+) Transcript_23419:1624-2517(+)